MTQSQQLAACAANVPPLGVALTVPTITADPEPAMRCQRRLLPVMILTLLSTSVASSLGDEPVPNELPRSWSLEEIASQALPPAVRGRVYVLAWQILEGDQSTRLERCLVLKVLENDQGYDLQHLCRRPGDEKPEWSLAMAHVSDDRPKFRPGRVLFRSKRFESPPSNKDIYSALSFKEVDWSFKLEKGCRFVGCGVCEESWTEAIGEKPTRFFGRQSRDGKTAVSTEGPEQPFQQESNG